MRYAKLSQSQIRSFADLTKREMQVFAFLQLCRNESTGLCKPGRKTIIEGTGIGKSHISEAVAGLEAKCWIIIRPEGFQFPPVKVPESGTIITATKVPKSGTKVPKSGTKVPKSGTLLNKELLTTNKQRINNEGARAVAIAEIKPDQEPATESIPIPIADSKRPRAIPIPSVFPLTGEMRDYTATKHPRLDVDAAHLDFIEYWTNCTKKNRLASNWPLRWKKGMRLAEGWQIRDNAGRIGTRRPDPGQDPTARGCPACNFAGVVAAPAWANAVDFWGTIDCPACRPAAFAEMFETLTGEKYQAAA